MKTEYFNDEEMARTSLKGWNNLDRLARVLVENKAINAETALSLSSLARRVEMDVSHVTRLLRNKPGFVRVMRQTGANKPPISVGVFYLPAIYARAQESHNYYPPQVSYLLRYAMSLESGLPKVVIHEDFIEKKRPSAIKHDPALASTISQIDGDVLVPYRAQVKEQPWGVFINVAGVAPSAVDDYNVSDLPIKDLAELQELMAKKLTSVAAIYAMLTETLADKEIR